MTVGLKRKTVDLKAKPFYLKEEAIQWVQDTINGMTLEEKVGQLFIGCSESGDVSETLDLVRDYHIGGIRYMNKPASELREEHVQLQSATKVPLLIAANCDSGGDGAMSDGTYIATAAACGATDGTETSYHVGQVSGREGSAIGCNWTFGPVADILFNWRNTIVNTRAYGDEVAAVLGNARAYIKGVNESGMAACAKHFPGDGVEERDQHLIMGLNDLSIETWDKSFGKVYQELIDDGLQSIMVGHIAMPDYSRKFRPGIRDEDILPATLAPELLQDLLRDQLGFNGLLMTDASHMAGMTSQLPRSEQVPRAIAAGCDMFLYFNVVAEDFQYMLDGYKAGILTEERLQEALERILGLKASLRLHEKQTEGNLVPPVEGLAVIGSEEHLRLAKEAAAASITLLKDTKNQLPISPETHKRVRLYYVNAAPQSRDYQSDPIKKLLVEELEAAGFEVDPYENYYDLEQKESKFENMITATTVGSVEEFKAKYDAVFYFVHMKGYAQENVVRLSYSTGHAAEIPWFCPEVPTVGISLNYTTHLNDLPMMRTFVNAYAPTRAVIRETIQKIAGKAAFNGTANSIVFCDRWDTRL
jgi:beta-N-acetylhexosaminidase